MVGAVHPSANEIVWRHRPSSPSKQLGARPGAAPLPLRHNRPLDALRERVTGRPRKTKRITCVSNSPAQRITVGFVMQTTDERGRGVPVKACTQASTNDRCSHCCRAEGAHNGGYGRRPNWRFVAFQ